MTLHRPTPTRTARAHVGTCAICARKLLHPGKVVPALGMVGPECEQRIGDLLTHLQANQLGALMLTGEVRIECQRAANGLYAVPAEAVALSVAAKRCGLLTIGGYEPGQPPVWTVRLDPRSVVAYFRRPAVQA